VKLYVRKKPNGDLSPTISTRLNPDSYKMLKEHARKMGIPISAFLRIWIDRTMKANGGMPALTIEPFTPRASQQAS
jgi:hypothetical protein